MTFEGIYHPTSAVNISPHVAPGDIRVGICLLVKPRKSRIHILILELLMDEVPIWNDSIRFAMRIEIHILHQLIFLKY